MAGGVGVVGAADLASGGVDPPPLLELELEELPLVGVLSTSAALARGERAGLAALALSFPSCCSARLRQAPDRPLRRQRARLLPRLPLSWRAARNGRSTVRRATRTPRSRPMARL